MVGLHDDILLDYIVKRKLSIVNPDLLTDLLTQDKAEWGINLRMLNRISHKLWDVLCFIRLEVTMGWGWVSPRPLPGG